MMRCWTRADIPMGHYFRPSDEELVKFYLLQWSLGQPSPIQDLILHTDIYGDNSDPRLFLSDASDPHWDTISDVSNSKKVKRVMYVMTKLSKVNPSNTRIARRAGRGTWSGQTPPRKIHDPISGGLIGLMRMFTFEADDQQKKGDSGHWIMHEYSLAGESLADGHWLKHKDHVLCRITWTREEPSHSGSKRWSPDEQRVIEEEEEEGYRKKKKKKMAMISSSDCSDDNMTTWDVELTEEHLSLLSDFLSD